MVLCYPMGPIVTVKTTGRAYKEPRRGDEDSMTGTEANFYIGRKSNTPKRWLNGAPGLKGWREIAEEIETLVSSSSERYAYKKIGEGAEGWGEDLTDC